MKLLLPEAVSQDDGSGAVPGTLFPKKCTAQNWAYIQNFEKALCDHGSLHSHRLSLAAKSPINSIGECNICAKLLIRAVLFAPIEEIVSPGHARKTLGSVIWVLNPNQARRITERKRTQEERVKETENGCIRSDTKRERDHGDGREARASAKGADGETQILDHGKRFAACDVPVSKRRRS
jgi:hypothetical protein